MAAIPFLLNGPVNLERDYRGRIFEGLPWFERLLPPEDRITAVSLLAKGQEDRWEVQLLNAALALAIDHEPEDSYRRRLCLWP